jgi:hypothetical protein
LQHAPAKPPQPLVLHTCALAAAEQQLQSLCYARQAMQLGLQASLLPKISEADV